MEKIKIEFDYSHGPLWEDKFDVISGEWSTGIPLIDHDQTIKVLNNEASKLYTSLYEFDNGGCVFNQNKFMEIKKELLSLVQAIIYRLSVINDGSFVVIDNATELLI